MLTRNPRLPAEARAALAPLESLPPEAIPDTAVSAAVALAVLSNAIAFKTVRADSLLRIQNEAAILMQLAAHFAGTFQNGLCICTKLVGAFRKSVRCSIQKLRNHPEPSPEDIQTMMEVGQQMINNAMQSDLILLLLAPAGWFFFIGLPGLICYFWKEHNEAQFRLPMLRCRSWWR